MYDLDYLDYLDYLCDLDYVDQINYLDYLLTDYLRSRYRWYIPGMIYIS